MKCKHSRLTIKELWSSYFEHQRYPDGDWSSYAADGESTGVVIVSCRDCGYQRRFTKRRPRWVARMLAEAIGGDQ